MMLSDELKEKFAYAGRIIGGMLALFLFVGMMLWCLSCQRDRYVECRSHGFSSEYCINQ